LDGLLALQTTLLALSNIPPHFSEKMHTALITCKVENARIDRSAYSFFFVLNKWFLHTIKGARGILAICPFYEKRRRNKMSQNDPYPYRYSGQQSNPYAQQGWMPAQQGAQMPQSQGMLTSPPSAPPTSSTGSTPGMLPLEESYIENILRLNKGKIATVYMTFENNKEWNAKVFKGVIEAAGKDHLILSDPQTNTRYLLPMVYLDYITFDEEISYQYPFAQRLPGSYSPGY
jgi:spore germination protein Q